MGWGIIGAPECPDAPLKMWSSVELGYYSFNMLFVYSYYAYVKKHNRESLKFLIANILLNVIHVSWLIYGNVIYYKYND